MLQRHFLIQQTRSYGNVGIFKDFEVDTLCFEVFKYTVPEK